MKKKPQKGSRTRDRQKKIRLCLHVTFFSPVLSTAPLNFFTFCNVMCVQHQRNTCNPFSNGDKNRAKNVTCKPGLKATFWSRALYIPRSLQGVVLRIRIRNSVKTKASFTRTVTTTAFHIVEKRFQCRSMELFAHNVPLTKTVTLTARVNEP